MVTYHSLEEVVASEMESKSLMNPWAQSVNEALRVFWQQDFWAMRMTETLVSPQATCIMGAER